MAVMRNWIHVAQSEAAYCSRPPGDDRHAVRAALQSSHVVFLYAKSTTSTLKSVCPAVFTQEEKNPSMQTHRVSNVQYQEHSFMLSVTVSRM